MNRITNNKLIAVSLYNSKPITQHTRAASHDRRERRRSTSRSSARTEAPPLCLERMTPDRGYRCLGKACSGIASGLQSET